MGYCHTFCDSGPYYMLPASNKQVGQEWQLLLVIDNLQPCSEVFSSR
jgi:hypothetical protein